jgi:hypothetical protein
VHEAVGGKNLDQYNRKLVEIVKGEPTGMDFVTLARKFARSLGSLGSTAVATAPSIGELHYRLEYLTHRRHLIFDSASGLFTARTTRANAASKRKSRR